MVCEGFLQPFDLQCLLVNVFSGHEVIFVILALVAIAVIGGMFRMTGVLLAMGVGLFSIFFYDMASWLYYSIIFFMGIIVFYSITKFFQR